LIIRSEGSICRCSRYNHEPRESENSIQVHLISPSCARIEP
jgi:hypothetical protein